MFKLFVVFGLLAVALQCSAYPAEDATTASAAPCLCEPDFNPLCGKDGLLYGNRCVFKCINAQRKAEGKEPIEPAAFQDDCFPFIRQKHPIKSY
ncbi:hypothetical protein NE865_08220 [Phthorimaea operculella]|nr:hypothetical protein NE865_08220 [Phthorimaea operculella]